MSSQTSRLSDGIHSHNDQLREVCPVGINLWRVAKALLYSGVIIGMAIVALHYEAKPTWISILALTGVLVVFLGEVKEIQVAHFVTVTFKNGKSKADDES